MTVTFIASNSKGKWIEFYQVPSHSRPGTSYIVAKDRNEAWGCSCPAWTQHTPRKDCKHIKEVRAAVGKGTQAIQTTTLAVLEKTAPAAAKAISRFSLVEVDE